VPEKLGWLQPAVDGQSSGHAFIEHEVSRIIIIVGGPPEAVKKFSSDPLLGFSRFSRRDVVAEQHAPRSGTAIASEPVKTTALTSTSICRRKKFERMGFLTDRGGR